MCSSLQRGWVVREAGKHRPPFAHVLHIHWPVGKLANILCVQRRQLFWRTWLSVAPSNKDPEKQQVKKKWPSMKLTL